MEYTYYFCSLLYLDDIARGHDAAEFVLGRLAQQHGTRSLNRDIGHTLRLVAEFRRNLNIDIARHEHTLDMPKLGLAHVKQATHGALVLTPSGTTHTESLSLLPYTSTMPDVPREPVLTMSCGLSAPSMSMASKLQMTSPPTSAARHGTK